MNLDQAANFFVGSILVMLASIVIAAGIVVINNIFARYWRTVRFFWPISTLEEYRNEHTQQPSGSQEDRTGNAGNKQQSNKN